MCVVCLDLIAFVQLLSVFVKAIVYIHHVVHIMQLLKSICMLQHAATNMVAVTHVSVLV